MQFFNSSRQVILQALIPGKVGNAIDRAYVEFSNAGAVEPVDYTDTTIVSYYDSMGQGNIDYMDVPVLSYSFDTTDNQLKLIIAADGDTGKNGLPFGTQSTVFAVSLVSSRSGDNPPIFVARHAYATSEQLVKPSTGTIVLTAILL